MLLFMPNKNRIQFLKDQLRQNTSINLDVLTTNIALKVTLVKQTNSNKTNSKEELGVSQEDKYLVKSIDIYLANIASQEKLRQRQKLQQKVQGDVRITKPLQRQQGYQPTTIQNVRPEEYIQVTP